MRKLIFALTILGIAACQPADTDGEAVQQETAAQAEAESSSNGSERLASVLAAQPEESQARYQFRHPQETLAFFEVEPGMTVVEALPGGGWYTKLLLPYVGAEGQVIGADYALDMYPRFGFFSEEQLEARKTWIADFTADAEQWRGENGAPISAFVLGSMPEELHGTADRVLFIRALHNLSRFESVGDYLSTALGDAYDALKPGGIVGVVQHQAPQEMSDEWAIGDHGYLKKAKVIEFMQHAGFEFVGEIDINQNPKDQPGEEDIVWRLPPTFVTSRENPKLRAELELIGESNRMTLKFRKPE